MDCRKKENGYVIMSALNSDYVIDLSGGIISEGRNIQLYQSNDSKAQRWNFTKMEFLLIEVLFKMELIHSLLKQ